MNVMPRASQWEQLIRPDMVHGSLYTDPAIFEAELKNIWYRTWVYVGHESEVPNANDYVVKSIGPQSVIMTRDEHCPPHVHVGGDDWIARFKFSFWHDDVCLWDVTPAKNKPREALLENLRQTLLKPANLRKARELWWSTLRAVCLDHLMWQPDTQDVVSPNSAGRGARKIALLDEQHFQSAPRRIARDAAAVDAAADNRKIIFSVPGPLPAHASRLYFPCVIRDFRPMLTNRARMPMVLTPA